MSENEKQEDEWISITQAGIVLGVRYLKARDLMTTGQLGEIRQTSSNRYFVRRAEVLRYKETMSSTD